MNSNCEESKHIEMDEELQLNVAAREQWEEEFDGSTGYDTHTHRSFPKVSSKISTAIDKIDFLDQSLVLKRFPQI